MNAHRRSRLLRGFTLVELLVVIAIIGVLVSLLLPAVQSAREAARRMQCTNNLHNLALACHNYHDSLGSFPNSHFCTPVTPGGAACVANEESWGWQVLILPYVEQKPLYDQLGVLNYGLDDVLAKKNPSLPDPRSMLQTKLSIYICPSDSNPADPVSSADRHFGGGLGTTAGGWEIFSQVFAITCPTAVRETTTKRPGSANQDTHGMFMEGSAKRFQDVIDGTSNTFLLGERDTMLCRSGTWIGMRNANGDAERGFYYVTANVRVRLNAPDPPIAWNTTARTGCYEGFSSLHIGGANFALTDGSVRFVSNNIEFKPGSGRGLSGATRNNYDIHSRGNPEWAPVYSVYTRLGRRNDGFSVGDF